MWSLNVSGWVFCWAFLIVEGGNVARFVLWTDKAVMDSVSYNM